MLKEYGVAKDECGVVGGKARALVGVIGGLESFV
jgi:hypothetical protein